RPRASRRRTRSRDRWPRAAAWPRRLRTPRAPCPGAATATAAGSEPVLLRSYLYLRRGCRGGSRLDGTHQLRDHAIEELVHLLRCPADVGGGIELAGRRTDTQPLELGCAGQPLEQVVGALQALAADDLVELLAVPAGLYSAHQQALGGEKRHRAGDVLRDRLLTHFETGGDVGGEHENRVGPEERLRNHQPAMGAVIERALEPLRRRGVPGVALELDHEARKTRHALGAHWIALVGHRGRADLFALERLEQLALVLQQAQIRGELRRRLCDP